MLVLLCLLASWMPEVAAAAEPASPATPLPAYQPRFGRSQPLIAVIGENRYTELSDYVVPYGVLRESGAAEVIALGTDAGPIRMFPALTLRPQADIATFDRRYPQGADYVIVPAVHHADDPRLLDWLRQQAAKGAVMVGICDGVWSLAHAGLLEGRSAVGHWYSFDELASRFPRTRFVRDRRYLADGPVITTTGVSASIPVSLALVEAIAGRQRASTVASSLGIGDWSDNHRSAAFKLDRRHFWTAASNWLAFWSHQQLDIPIADGVDEISLALLADAWSRTYRSNAATSAAGSAPVTSLRGLQFEPDHAGRQPADPTLSAGKPPGPTLAEALKSISHRYGTATAAFVALQLEYPWP